MNSIFLINLARSTERLTHSTNQFKRQSLDFTRIEAIDGLSLTQPQIDKNYSPILNKKKYHYPLSKGQIGCYLSHRKAWQAIVDQKLDYALIFEDDFTLDHSIHTAIKNIERLPLDWQIIKLAAYQNRKRPIVFKSSLGNNQELVIHKKLMSGCCATAVSFQGAMRLLESTKKFGRPVDCDLQHIWETGVPGYSLLPYPVKQKNDGPSDIGARSSIKIKKAFFRRKSQQLIANANNAKFTAKFVKQTQTILSPEIQKEPKLLLNSK